MGGRGGKGRGRGKSAAEPAPAGEFEGAGPVPVPVQGEVIGSANDEVILEVSDAIKKITENVLFADIFRAKPLTMDGGQPKHLTGHKVGQAMKFDAALTVLLISKN